MKLSIIDGHTKKVLFETIINTTESIHIPAVGDEVFHPMTNFGVDNHTVYKRKFFYVEGFHQPWEVEIFINERTI